MYIDVLPVVQFFLEDDIRYIQQTKNHTVKFGMHFSDDEAMHLIKSEPQSKKASDWTEITADSILQSLI